MTTITKERIELFIKNPLENGLTRGEQMELARIALEALTAEPVAEVRARYPLGIDGGKQKFIQVTGELPDFGGHLYAAPPAPVSVPDGLKQAVEFYEQVNQENIPVETGAWKDAVNWVLEEACRATMLQANQRDLSQPVDPQVAEYEQIMLQAGNSPVTPDDWISCSERMPAQDDWVLIYSKHGEYLAGQVQGEYVELNDGTLSWLGSALHWMLLPEPPQEVK
ncbi:TPA: DUF551 domain-containing protein [Salmonella enterica subsp. enterica serovar Muenchen]